MADLTSGAVAERVAHIHDRVASALREAGEPARAVRVVAVTKGFGPDAVVAALGAGLHDIAENYAQEMLAKVADERVRDADIRWHFLGAIQRNKVHHLAPHVSLWQSVDRIEAGREIAKRAPGAQVLVQVNLAGDPGRNGCTWADAPALVTELRALDLDVRGLMGVASMDPKAAEQEFARLAGLRDELGLTELSIGMTDDLEAAVAAGSTMIRVGRALFGERPGAPRGAAEMRR